MSHIIVYVYRKLFNTSITVGTAKKPINKNKEFHPYYFEKSF